MSAWIRWVVENFATGLVPTSSAPPAHIIFLDVSRWTSLVGALCRRLRGEARDDIADGCPEKLGFEFLRWLWRYHDHHRPGVLEQLGNFVHGRTIVTLHDRHEIEQWLLRLRDGTTR